MKSFSSFMRPTACLLLMPLGIFFLNAQEDPPEMDQLKIFHFHHGYYDNAVDTAGNVLFDEDWSVLFRLEECGCFLGIRMLEESTKEQTAFYDGVPAEYALLSPDGRKDISSCSEIGSVRGKHITVRTPGGWGVMDCKGNWILEPGLEEAPILYDGHILIPEHRTDSVSGPRPVERLYVGLADYSGKVLLPARYSDILALDWWSATHFILTRGDRSSLVNGNAETVIPMGRYYIYPSLAEESVWVLSDSAQKVYRPDPDEWTTGDPQEFTRGWYGCTEGFSIEVIDNVYRSAAWKSPDGSILIPASPDDVRMSFKHPYLRIRKDGRYGVVTRSGKTVVPCIYDNIYRAPMPDNPESSWVRCVFEGTLSVELNGGWGLVDTAGNYLTHLIYDELQGTSEGIVAAKTGGKTGFIDVHGNRIIPFVFDWTNEPWENGIGTAYLGGSTVLVNRSGRILVSELGPEGPASVEMLSNRESPTPLEIRLGEILDEAGDSKEEVKWVNLMDGGLTSLPKEVLEFGNLEILDLPNNFISGIPYRMGGFKNLEFVDLSGNIFRDFPVELLDIKALSVLLLEGNVMESIPAAVFTHPGMSEIHLAGNRIGSLPDPPARNKTLESLGLEGNLIKSIPPSITNLAGLKYLYLSDNRIGELPPEIGRMRSLVSLLLGGNQLEALPEDLSGMKSLHTIDLSNNRLKSIPESLLRLPSLSRVILKGNPVPAGEISRIMELRPDLTVE